MKEFTGKENLKIHFDDCFEFNSTFARFLRQLREMLIVFM
jgi:hypothetical protein